MHLQYRLWALADRFGNPIPSCVLCRRCKASAAAQALVYGEADQFLRELWDGNEELKPFAPATGLSCAVCWAPF